MRIAFFGTPDFAVPTLELLSKSRHEIEVFTQPDKPVGRKGILTPPPVKQKALELGLKVHQFEKISRPEGVEALKAFAPELLCVVAFGQLFSQEVLSIPPLGAINVHGSLLPAYRGASPIQQSVIHGDAMVGVSTMLLVKRMDAGDVLLQAATPLGAEESYGELSQRLSHMGAQLFMDTLQALEEGRLQRHPQNEDEASYCKMLTRDSGYINPDMGCKQAHNLVRGTDPWPGAYVLIGQEKLKLWRTRPYPGRVESEIGTFFGSPKEGLYLQCRDGALQLLQLQGQGGKRMEAAAFLRGHGIIGDKIS